MYRGLGQSQDFADRGVPVKKKNRARVSVCEFFMPCLLIECVTPFFGLSACSLELLALRGEVIITTFLADGGAQAPCGYTPGGCVNVTSKAHHQIIKYIIQLDSNLNPNPVISIILYNSYY